MNAIKTLSGLAMALANRQCRFENACFLIGHMRCGSTALSAILCTREDVSGYGEAHISYRSRSDLGLLALNQWKRQAWKRAAPLLFDKLLHNRYDIAAPGGFFAARAIFMARDPAPAIASIRQLFIKVPTGEYATDEEAALYYCQRLEAMLALWPRFAGGRATAITYDALVASPDAGLARISRRLDLSPPLVNQYRVTAATQVHGAGDPINAARFDRITAMSSRARDAVVLEVRPATLERAQTLYQSFHRLTEVDQ